MDPEFVFKWRTSPPPFCDTSIERGYKRKIFRASRRSPFFFLTKLRPVKVQSIWAHLQMACQISFKYASVHPNEDIFIKIAGSCNACGSILKAEMKREPILGNKAIFQCSYTGNSERCTNTQKRQKFHFETDSSMREFATRNEAASSFRSKLLLDSIRYK